MIHPIDPGPNRSTPENETVADLTVADDDYGEQTEPNPDLRLEVRPLSVKTGRSVIAVVAQALDPALATYVIQLFDEKQRIKLAEQLRHDLGVVNPRHQLEELANWLWTESY